MKKIALLCVAEVVFCVICGSVGIEKTAETAVPAQISMSDIIYQTLPVEKDVKTDVYEFGRIINIPVFTQLAVGTGKKIESFQPICQYPELPTGCEMTSLAMVLNYNNVATDKCDLSDNYLDKGPVGTVDFHVAFEGDPRDENSYGCYAPVVVNTANRYLGSEQSGLKASDISGAELEDLFKYIDLNIPVIVWGTQDCREGYYSVTWNVDGKELTWFTPEHCMVLTGYDDSMVWVSDPIYGDVRSYDRAVFKNRYDSLQKQAVIIK